MRKDDDEENNKLDLAMTAATLQFKKSSLDCSWLEQLNKIVEIVTGPN